MKTGFLFAILASLAWAADAPAAQDGAVPREAAATVVVYNNLDPSSVSLAGYYAKRRGIPADHVVGLNTSTAEEITRADYDSTIANPLRKIFTDHGWWHMPKQADLVVDFNQIRFIALIRGIPLKIAAEANYPGDTAKMQPAMSTNAAAVDSELATLGLRTSKISGPFNNLYFKSYDAFLDAPLAPFMCVCRLDGPTPEIVRNMIDGAISAEHSGLDGFAYVDIRGITTGAYADGDKWLATAAVALRHHGMPLVWDSSPDLFPGDFPMDHVAMYLGWYAADVAGPFARDDFRFVPGAIAVHIHSFSANTLRSDRSNWCGPLLAHGAAATIGNVYEPYLVFTTHLDIFADRLKNGFNFAEAAYAAQPVLSWMTTFVGDPLYRPFQNTGASAEGGSRPAIEYEAYRKGAQAWYQTSRAAGEKKLTASAKQLHSGIVWEGMGLLQWSVLDFNAALDSFRQAQQCYGKTEDGARTVLHQVEILKSTGKGDDARALATKALRTYGAFHGEALFRQDAASGSPAPTK